MSLPRLFVDHSLAEGQEVPLNSDQAHYLFNVLRLSPADGEQVLVFNGLSGEFAARISGRGKRDGQLTCLRQSAPQRNPPDLWLFFAPIKKARTDFIVEKACELGIAAIFPIETRHTNSERIRQDRLQAHAVEAAEQCGGTFVPRVAELVALRSALAQVAPERRLILCDETRTGEGVDWTNLAGPAALLIGPEGGFAEEERRLILARPNACARSLGPRILRADTAAVAALTLWQAANGDWRGNSLQG